MEYVRLCKGLSDKGSLIPETEINSRINSFDKDWYVSVFFYGDSELSKFKQTGSVAGIDNLKSNKLIFDFDSQDNVEKARNDTLDVCNKLLVNGITEDMFNICFSGNKGFSIEMKLDAKYDSKELKSIAKALAGDKQTFDTKIYNDNRIFRVPYTKHPVSGLYKTPISLASLAELSIEQIKEMAMDNSNGIEWKETIIQLPESMKVKLNNKIELKNIELLPEFERKAKWMSACKEAILNGYFTNGNRSHALMALAATFKANGFPKEVTHRALKGAAELQAVRHNTEPFDSDEIWNNIIKVVYSPNWKGATYSCKEHEWLADICKLTGKHSCLLKQKETVTTFNKLAGKFKDFAQNIEKNRIYTGIEELDKRIILTTSMPIGLLGAPGSGKTSVALDILNKTSNANVRSLFCSFDMGWNVVYAKLVSKFSGLPFEKVLEVYKTNKEAYTEYDDIIAEEFKNVNVTFDSSQSIDDIKKVIEEENSKSENPIKFVVIDYLECLSGPYSDPTANGSFLANKIKNLATELEICVMVLVQPPKSAGDASQPLTSMRQIKGASTLEQNFRAVLGVYREGFSPSTPENDTFMSIACLKNTLGGLFTVDLHWDGLKGQVRELSFDEQVKLEKLRDFNKNKDISDNWD